MAWYNKYKNALIGAATGGVGGSITGYASDLVRNNGGVKATLKQGVDSLGDAYGDITGRKDPGDIDRSNYGLPGYQERRKNLLSQVDHVGSRTSPVIGTSRFAGDQSNLIKTLQDRASGKGPSLASNMLRDAVGRNVSSQQAMMATGGSARAAMQNSARAVGSFGNQAANARITETNAAQGLLANTVQNARSQDMQRNMAQSDMELKSRGMNDAQIRALRELEQRNAQSQQQGNISYENAKLGQASLPTNNERALGALGQVIQTGAKAFGAP